MKRIGVSILLALSLIVSALPTANAVVTPGSKCSKAGVKQNYKSKIYTCIKLGKKLYWDNGITFSTKPSASPEKLVCSASTAGTLDPANKRERCVMVDDYGDNGQGGFTKVFGFTQEGIIPEWTLCRNDTQYWSNQTWYDGKWKCGYFADGGSKWGWHTSTSQFPSAIKQNYVVGNSTSQQSTSASPSPTSIGTSTSACQLVASSGGSGYVKVTLEENGNGLKDYVLTNTLDCTFSLSVSARFICTGGKLPVMGTASITIGPKQRVFLSASRYFPQADFECQSRLGLNNAYAYPIFVSSGLGDSPVVVRIVGTR